MTMPTPTGWSASCDFNGLACQPAPYRAIAVIELFGAVSNQGAKDV